MEKFVIKTLYRNFIVRELYMLRIIYERIIYNIEIFVVREVRLFVNENSSEVFVDNLIKESFLLKYYKMQ